MNTEQKCFIIAEAGVNHNGSLDKAKELVRVAADSGADAVKFQTFSAEQTISRFAPKAEYQVEVTDAAETQLEMVKKLELDYEAHLALFKLCEEIGIEFMSTPFDSDSVDLLCKLGVKRLKIASGEISNAPLLLKIAQAELPMILSTGMSTLEEVEEALGVLTFGLLNRKETPSVRAFRQSYASNEGRNALYGKVSILHCTTEYPAPISDVNLKAMGTLRKAFNLPVGLSDHTIGITVPIAAVAKDATIIEKHFTLDRNLSGPDHKASLEPDELKAMVKSIRQVEEAMGSEAKAPTTVEMENMKIGRRSLVAAVGIKKGEEFAESNLSVKRPGHGVSPFQYWEYLGKTAERDYREDEVID